MNMRIRLFCFLLLTTGSFTGQAQTLFSYGPQKVSKAEFVEAFQRNNTVKPATTKAYTDYLELYIRYKLKVQAAYDMHLDSLQNQLKEVNDFRAQIMPQYLADDSTMQVLVREGITRSREDRRISHIYIPFTGADTATAFAQAQAALQALKAGSAFEQVATEFSKDPSVAQNKGDIGWISVFVLPYALESLAYNTAVQQNSALYRSSDAYHIFRVTGTRPAKGFVQLQHILLTLPPNASSDLLSKLQTRADSIVSAVLGGADFGILARQYSDDYSTYPNNGIMNAFAPGTYDPAFETVAFSLATDNAVSKPFQTARGIHIIRRLTTYPFLSGDSTAQADAMKSRINADGRNQLATEAFYRKAKRQTGYREMPFAAGILDRYTTSFESGNTADRAALTPVTVLASTSAAHFTAKDYGDWLTINMASLRQSVPPFTNAMLYRRYLDEALMQEYQVHLDKYNPAFATQLKEFKDGNLIFEAMQREIWDKASNDDVGMQQYFAAHRDRYRWSPSFSGILFTATDSSHAAQFITALQKDPTRWSALLRMYDQSIIGDSGRFEMSQLSFSLSAAEGAISLPVFNKESLNYQFAYVMKKYPAGAQRSFADARGLVLNDYQQVLEDRWIARLKKKYPITVNKAVWQTILP